MWTLCNREKFEHQVAEVFPEEHGFPRIVVDGFCAEVLLVGDATSQQRRQTRIWSFGKVVVRYRFVAGSNLVEVLSVEKQTKARQLNDKTKLLLTVLAVLIAASLIVSFLFIRLRPLSATSN